MADVFSKEKRSWIMSRIRSRDTKIEKIMEQKLNELGIKFKKHYDIFGKPDFVIENMKIAIFCDGEFWHGYRIGKRIKKLPKYWQEKIIRNKKQAIKVNRKLKKEGWTVLRFWESEIENDVDKCLKRIKEAMKNKCGGE